MGLKPVRRIGRAFTRSLSINFLTVHYAYFVFTILVASVILWGSSTSSHHLRYIDALFLATSAMTEAGLNTVNLSTLNTFQQVVLFLLIIIGSAIFVSAFVVLFRRRAFEHKFDAIVREHRLKKSKGGAPSWSSLPFVRSVSRSRAGQDKAELTHETSKDVAIARHPPSRLELPVIGGAHSPVDSRNAAMSNVSPIDATSEQSPPAVETGETGRTLEAGPVNDSNTETGTVRDESEPHASQSHIAFSPNTFSRTSVQVEDGPPAHRRARRRSSLVSVKGVGAHPYASLRVAKIDTSSFRPIGTPIRRQFSPSTIGRNSTFFGLDDAERQRLGGVEYRALVLLSWLVPIYFVLWQLLSCLGLGAWVAANRPETTTSNGISPWWLGAFNAVSAFNNSGMSILDANMTVFQDAYYMLITMGLLILAGNTCYPIFLRLIIWTLYKLTPQDEAWDESRATMRFLLDHPRRCYTNLFPARHTWWLLAAVVVLNCVDWVAFEVLNIGNTALTSVLPVNLRVIDGLFQALAVRSGGFYVVPIPLVRISLQVLYVTMMYISVYPVVITMRNSNVYEERSLGIYSDDPLYNQQRTGVDQTQSGVEQQPPGFWRRVMGLGKEVTRLQESRSYFVRQQIRAQLAHDIWWLVLAVFAIMIVEGEEFERDPKTFSVFNVIFEAVSGYGTVGISVGVPYDNYSFCGAWKTLSKLILCAVMLRGRHRGLPVAIDRAIILPVENLGDVEEEDAIIRMQRSTSRARADDF